MACIYNATDHAYTEAHMRHTVQAQVPHQKKRSMSTMPNSKWMPHAAAAMGSRFAVGACCCSEGHRSSPTSAVDTTVASMSSSQATTPLGIAQPSCGGRATAQQRVSARVGEHACAPATTHHAQDHGCHAIPVNGQQVHQRGWYVKDVLAREPQGNGGHWQQRWH